MSRTKVKKSVIDWYIVLHIFHIQHIFILKRLEKFVILSFSVVYCMIRKMKSTSKINKNEDREKNTKTKHCLCAV